MSPKDGLVVSIEGPWGAGKSSALALTVRTIMLRVLTGVGEGQHELEKLTESELDARWVEKAKQRNIHIVRFNPWNFSGQENLVRAFFNELAGQIDVDPDGALNKAMNRLAGFLPSVAGGLAAGAMLMTGNLPAAAAAGAAGRSAGEIGERALKSESSLEGAKKKLAAALRDANQRIIVIVDDLDRLMPSEMRAVFSLVKSLGDLPNVLYLLSFDEAVVHTALQHGAEKIDPEFLEKIVQVSLKLPPPWRDELHRMLIDRLNTVVGDAEPADQSRWRRMVMSAVDPYLETPRDVTRLVNTLRVIWPNVAGDVDLTDLIAITTLQLFDPKVYELIRDEIEIITHASYRYENDDDFGKRMEPVSAKNPEAAKDAMALLFPRIAKVWNKHMSDGAYYVVQKEQRRVCTKEYYRNYFVFGRDARRLTRAEVEAVILNANPSAALAATLKRLSADPHDLHPPRRAALLEQLGEALYAKPLLTPALLQAILDHSDDLIRREDQSRAFFLTDNKDRLGSIIRLGMQNLNLLQRAEILKTLVSYHAGLQTRADAVEDDARSHGLFGGKQKHASEQFFAADKIEAAALSIRKQIAAACNDGSVWGMPMPIRLIWAWKRMGGGPSLERWLKSAIRTDAQLVQLANGLPGKSYRSSERGESVRWTFNREDYKDWLDVETLFARLERLARKNPEAKAALDRLREAEKPDDE